MKTLWQRLQERVVYFVVTAILAWATSYFGVKLPSPESVTQWIIAAGAIAGLGDWLKLMKQHAWPVLWGKVKALFNTKQ